MTAAVVAWAIVAAATAAIASPPPASAPSGAGSCAAAACHGRLLTQAHLHPPAESGDCETCHRATGKPHPGAAKGAAKGFALAEAGAKLCEQCHDPRVPAGSKSAHVPVAQGECTACHDPHGSPNEHLLHQAPTNKVCADCHDQAARAEAVRTPHPAAVDDCLNCHDPHAAAQPHLLKKPLNELCFQCHEEKDFKVHVVRGVRLGTSHPLSGVEDPSHKGSPLGCPSCHNPHGTDTPTLWQFGAQSMFDLCQNCHKV